MIKRKPHLTRLLTPIITFLQKENQRIDLQNFEFGCDYAENKHVIPKKLKTRDLATPLRKHLPQTHPAQKMPTRIQYMKKEII